MINTSDLLIRIRFPRGHDLLTILGVCYCVQKEDETRAKNLEKYSSCLLPWAIVAIVTRRTADWSLLARDSDAWEEMVRTVIERTNNEAIERMNKEPQMIGESFSPMAKKYGTTSEQRSEAPSPDLFVPKINTILREALMSTRDDIEKFLSASLFRDTIYPTVHQIVNDAAKNAMIEASLKHAADAAQGAAIQEIFKVTWRTFSQDPDGRIIWQDTRNSVTAAISKARDAVARAAGQAYEVIADAAEWEQAWDRAWADSLDTQASSQVDQHKAQVGVSRRPSISMLAKEAWREAWDEACKAHAEFVPRICDEVARYIAEHLPSPSSEMLTVELDKDDPLAAILRRDSQWGERPEIMIPGMIDSRCQRVFAIGESQDPSDIKGYMRRVWIRLVEVLPA
ncbi:hypothetical protein RhiJN_20813 [Ceratobasidium sp. AG-Ba]|nr:hypothetical protein RhiJN_20813 [Ceratobasidium sp. AG-Ba]